MKKKLELLIIDERAHNGIRVCLKSNKNDVITPTLIKRVRHFQNSLMQRYAKSPWDGYLYIIWYACRGGNFFNGSIDFNYVYSCLEKNKIDLIKNYINNIFEMLFLNYIHLGLPIINCSIVEQDTRGISREFFSLNKINFIKKSTLIYQHENYSKASIDQFAKYRAFPDFLYKKNQFYLFEKFNLSLMKEILSEIDETQFNLTELDEIKEIFNKIKQKTMRSLYLQLTNNPNLIKRAAQIQR